MASSVFSVFLWKNYKYSVSEWKIIAFQFVGFIAILSTYMSATYNTEIINKLEYEYKSEDELKSFFSGEEDDLIFYTPSNIKLIDQLMEDVRMELSIAPTRLKSLDSANETCSQLQQRYKTRSLAVMFDLTTNETLLPRSIIYNISSTIQTASTSTVYVNDEEVVGIKDYDSYINSGFFILQRIIDKCYTKLVTSQSDNVLVEVEVAPIPFVGMMSVDNTRVVTFGVMFSFFFFIYLLSTFLVPLVEEKQDGIKEFLVLTTPYNYMNGITFYLIRFSFMFAFVIASLIIGYLLRGLGSAPFLYMLVLFTLFTASAMCYGFLISVLFSSVFYAKIGGLILLLMPTALFTFEVQILRPLSYILSASTFLEGMTTFQKFTIKHRDFGSEHLDVNITELSFKMSTVYVTLIVQCCVYSILYWYFAHLFPGEGGIKKPFYFMFQSSFYKKHKAYGNGEDPLNPDVAVKITNLTKSIKTWSLKRMRNEKKIIVDNVSMDIGSKKITVLLGHNGAGKTTTLNMITGCVEKTQGNIRVCNMNEVSIYRHLIGFCPQHNVFMRYLSCKEHLKFFARLRGLNNNEAETLAVDLLGKLRLKEKANEPGRKLSGGMKRRLSLGLAISGNTRVIILDEPSSGLDPDSRRELWNILLELRKTQTIFITTHHMEEAEVLGDNVVILSGGRLICSGSTLELKRKYGSGYVLKLLVTNAFNLERIIKIVNESIPTAKIKSVVHPTVCISLPYEYHNQYQKVLYQLEQQATVLGISTISFTNTSLEEVFLKCESYDENDSSSQDSKQISIPYEQFEDSENNPTKNPEILVQQFFAVFYKKFIFIKRELPYTLFMIAIPLLCSFISCSMVRSHFVAVDSGPLELNVNSLPKTEIYLKISDSMNAWKDLIETEIYKSNLKVSYIKNNQSLTEELLTLQNENLTYFYDYVMGALEVVGTENSPVFRILHSGNIIHSSVMMLNLVDNIIFKYFSNGHGEIKTFNVPCKRITEISPARLEYFNIIMPVGWLFYMIFFITLPFKEEKSEFKKLQFAPRLVYWLSFTFFDIIMHIIVCILAFCILEYAIPNEVYNTNELVWLMFSFIFYGISYLPILYILSISFKSMSTLSACFLLIASVSSIAPLITSSNQNSMEQYQDLINVMLILPDFSLNHQLRLIGENYFIARRNGHAVSTQPPNFNLTTEQVGSLNTTIFFYYAVFVYVLSELILILLWDDVRSWHILRNMCLSNCCKRTAKASPTVDEESDVSGEKQTVQDILKGVEDMSNYPLIVQNLHKYYDKKHAVRGLNFAVQKGECFGLLGINGAGKTSTFQMITANANISDGKAFVKGVNIFENENKYKFLFGYCPQVDALNDFMTSYEILKYMALLRGIRYRNVHYEVMCWLSRLDLIKYADIPIKNYSGGTKRKLNTAIAMIGSPPVLFLDEPTTGVDPISRRLMWKCIKEFQKDNKTIVLTSHSMDECEHLCNRLAIMANGQFECIGFIPSLKVKFGSGFTLTFRLESFTEASLSSLESNLRRMFKCKLKEQHADIVTYFVQETNIVWSEVVQKVDIFFNENINIKDVSINETTLEDIFLWFEAKSKKSSEDI